MWSALAIAGMVIAVATFYSAVGAPRRSLKTPLHTTAPGISYGCKGMLKLGDKTLWG
jgi:hypothetical protein